MRVPRLLFPAATVTILLLAGCAATPTASPVPSTASPASPSPTITATEQSSQLLEDEVVGTVVRFTSDQTSVDVTIDQDTPAVRDFLSMLPFTLDLEEYNGREKIGYPPRDIERGDTPGSDPEDGDFIYFEPWGNLGFYYNAEGSGFEDTTLHLGTYDATLEQLTQLEGTGIDVAIVP